MNESKRMCQIRIRPKKTRVAMVKAHDICMYCETSSVRRRSSLSARTPPSRVKSMIGNCCRNASRPSKNAEPLNDKKKPVLGDILHPRADAGGARAKPQDAEIAVCECCHHPAHSLDAN